MTLIEVIILGIVQGVTEFLPISSDGHLVVANALLDLLGREAVPDLLEVTIALHLGTLASVLIFYRRDIVRVLTTARRAIVPIVVGTIPAVVFGLWIEKGLSESTQNWLLTSPMLAGVGFLVTAAALLWSSRAPEGDVDYPEVPAGKAFVIGVLQASAILPGVSRSGMTIAGGLVAGLRRDAAAAFSFLLAIPAIAGAGLLKTLEAVEKGATSTPLPTLAVGFVVSMVVGIAALAALLRFLRHGKLVMFVYYLVPLAIAVIAWQMAKA